MSFKTPSQEEEGLGKVDLIKGIVLLIFSFVVCYEACRLPLGSFKKPGPGFFPLLLGITLFGLSTLFIILNGFKRFNKEVLLWPSGAGQRVFVTLSALIAYGAVFSVLGYLVSTFLLIFYLLSMTYARKWVMVGIASLLITIAFYIVFQVFLKIQFPSGILGI